MWENALCPRCKGCQWEGGGLEVGAFASLILSCRSATDFVRAVMELFRALRSVWSCLFGRGSFAGAWEGIPRISWKVVCV
jgi:hypothetical protein